MATKIKQDLFYLKHCKPHLEGAKSAILNILNEHEDYHLNAKLLTSCFEGAKFHRIVGGIGVPGIGTIQKLSNNERKVIDNIAEAREQSESYGHIMSSFLIGKDDPFVAKYKSAYQKIIGMMPGDLAKINVDKKNYYLAALPPQDMFGLENSFVLFLNK